MRQLKFFESKISLNGVTANNGVRTENLATLQAEKWDKVRVTLDNNFEEYSAVVMMQKR